MRELKDFIDYTLKPAIFAAADRVFPEMDFKPFRGGWASSKGIGGRTPNHHRQDKSIISRAQPFRILEQGADSIEVIAYYQQYNGIAQPIDAIKAICSIVGLELPPMQDSAGYVAYRDKQDRLHKVLRTMQEALPTAAPLAAFFGGRGWTLNEAQEMGLGYCTAATAAQIKEILGTDSTYFPQGAGTTHPLAIPYISGGDIKGFIFRALEPTITPKYVKVFSSKKDTQIYNLFGLTGLPVKGTEWDKTITIVEGELDTLRATAKGVPNIVSAASKNIPVESLVEAKRKGVERVVLLLDWDGVEKAAERQEDIKKALGIVRSVGLKGLVAAFPQEGEKVDADSYLNTHTGEELQTLIESAIIGGEWELLTLFEKYQNIELTGAKELDFIDDITRLVYSSNLPPIEQQRVITLVDAYSGGRITKANLLEELEKRENRKKAAEQKAVLEAAINNATEALKSGNLTTAFAEIDKASQAQEISKEAAYNKYLQTPTAADMLDTLKSKQVGIPTGYMFKGERKEVELELPTAALTYICAPTSQGKSRFLQNLALNLAADGNAGEVLYISLEEDSAAVVERFINLYNAEELNAAGNNSALIRSYFSTGSTQYIKGDKVEHFKQSAQELLSLIEQGKLRIISRNDSPNIAYSQELAGAITYIAKSTNLKAVFIDYVQLIYSKGNKGSRKEELMEICNTLMEISVKTGLPIVLAAQLNREAVSPLDMSVQHIADASNIEHSANMVLLLWDSKVLPTAGKDNAYRYQTTKGTESGKKEYRLTAEAEALEEKGFKCGESGKVYALLAKNRAGERNIEAILDCNPNTGKITQNKAAALNTEAVEDNSLELDLDGLAF